MIVVDRTSVVLRDVLTDEVRTAAVADDQRELNAIVLAALKGRQSRTRTCAALLRAIQVAEQKLASICGRHSVEFWFPLVRRMASFGILGNWMPYATGAILKYSRWEEDTRKIRRTESGEPAFEMSEDDALSVWRIAVLSATIADYLAARRVCSKGGRIVDSGGTMQTDMSPELELSIHEYERRRPHATLFQDRAVPVFHSGEDIVLGLVPLVRPRLVHVQGAGYAFPIHFLFQPIDREALAAALRQYDRALRDRAGAGAEAILQCLVALTMNIVFSIVPFELEADELTMDVDVAKPDEKHRLDFTYDLLQRGILHFSREKFEAALARYPIPTASGRSAEQLVADFFDLLVLRPEHREALDILTLQPVRFLYPTPSGEYFCDLMLVEKFIESMFAAGQSWYGSMHGDDFHLVLKTLIDSQAPAARVIGENTSLKTSAGAEAKPDLLVLAPGNRLFVVECKAHSKPRPFLIGDPRAPADRQKMIAADVAQARRSEAVVRRCMAEGSLDGQGASTVEWAVCGPTQEFIHPVDRYGYLDGPSGTPRVCTHEELLAVLQGRG